jgi:predicted ATPase
MDYIEIKGYKSINSERIELNNINILIGANGSGKSNFISFFDFLNRLYNKKLNDYIALSGGDNKILHKGKKNSDSISFTIEFDGGLNGYGATLVSGNDGFVFTEERLIYHGEGKDISRSSREARIKETSNSRALYIIKYLEGFRKYHFHDTSENSPFTESNNADSHVYFLYPNGSNIASILFDIHKSDKIVHNKIVKTIQSIAPYFSDFFFEQDTKSFKRLLWTDRYSDILFGATDLSDGTLRFIALTVLFMQPNLPDTIVIDEPELGLHPTAIAKLAGMIKSASAKGCQVIVATQSTDLISHFLPEDIITVDQVNGESKFTRLNPTELHEWLKDYTVDDLWKRSIITTGQLNF